jgi:signal peptidase II
VELIKKNWFFLAIVFLSFILDRLTKEYIINFFLNQKLESYYVNEFLNFVLVWNAGMAFGLFETETNFYHLLSFLIISLITFLFFWLFQSDSKFEKMSVSLIIGGALGNLYDRIIFRAVPDFIDLHYLDFHWFVFNVSDIIITIGIILLLFKEILIKNAK